MVRISRFLHLKSRVGIDLGSRWIKAVEICADGSAIRLARFPRSNEALDEVEIERVCEILRRKGFDLRAVSLLSTPESLKRQVLRLPDIADSTRDKAIVQNHFVGLDAEFDRESVIAWWDLPRGSRAPEGREVLAYASDPAITGAWVRGFEGQGVRVHGIDIHSAAVARGMPESECIVVDVGWSSAGVALIIRGLPVYERLDPALGIGQLIEREGVRVGQSSSEIEAIAHQSESGFGLMSSAASTPWIRAMSMAITATHEYAVRRYGLSESPRVVLMGGGATDEIAEALGANMGGPCDIWDAEVAAEYISALSTARRWAA